MFRANALQLLLIVTFGAPDAEARPTPRLHEEFESFAIHANGRLGTAFYILHDNGHYCVTAYHNLRGRFIAASVGTSPEPAECHVLAEFGETTAINPDLDVVALKLEVAGIQRMQQLGIKPLRFSNNPPRAVPVTVFGSSTTGPAGDAIRLNYSAPAHVGARSPASAALPSHYMNTAESSCGHLLFLLTIGIAPGFSGGPVIDPRSGHVVGLVQGGVPLRFESWAIPSDRIAAWLSSAEFGRWPDVEPPLSFDKDLFSAEQASCRLEAITPMRNGRLVLASNQRTQVNIDLLVHIPGATQFTAAPSAEIDPRITVHSLHHVDGDALNPTTARLVRVAGGVTAAFDGEPELRLSMDLKTDLGQSYRLDVPIYPDDSGWEAKLLQIVEGRTSGWSGKDWQHALQSMSRNSSEIVGLIGISNLRIPNVTMQDMRLENLMLSRCTLESWKFSGVQLGRGSSFRGCALSGCSLSIAGRLPENLFVDCDLRAATLSGTASTMALRGGTCRRSSIAGLAWEGPSGWEGALVDRVGSTGDLTSAAEARAALENALKVALPDPIRVGARYEIDVPIEDVNFARRICRERGLLAELSEELSLRSTREVRGLLYVAGLLGIEPAGGELYSSLRREQLQQRLSLALVSEPHLDAEQMLTFLLDRAAMPLLRNQTVRLAELLAAARNAGSLTPNALEEVSLLLAQGADPNDPTCLSPAMSLLEVEGEVHDFELLWRRAGGGAPSSD